MVWQNNKHILPWGAGTAKWSAMHVLWTIWLKSLMDDLAENCAVFFNFIIAVRVKFTVYSNYSPICGGDFYKLIFGDS